MGMLQVSPQRSRKQKMAMATLWDLVQRRQVLRRQLQTVARMVLSLAWEITVTVIETLKANRIAPDDS